MDKHLKPPRKKSDNSFKKVLDFKLISSCEGRFAPFYLALLLDHWKSWRGGKNVRIMTGLIAETGSLPEQCLSIPSYLQWVCESLRAPCFHSPAVGSLHVVGTAHKYAALCARLQAGEGVLFFHPHRLSHIHSNQPVQSQSAP